MEAREEGGRTHLDASLERLELLVTHASLGILVAREDALSVYLGLLTKKRARAICQLSKSPIDRKARRGDGPSSSRTEWQRRVPGSAGGAS